MCRAGVPAAHALLDGPLHSFDLGFPVRPGWGHGLVITEVFRGREGSHFSVSSCMLSVLTMVQFNGQYLTRYNSFKILENEQLLDVAGPLTNHTHTCLRETQGEPVVTLPLTS